MSLFYNKLLMQGLAVTVHIPLVLEQHWNAREAYLQASREIICQSKYSTIAKDMSHCMSLYPEPEQANPSPTQVPTLRGVRIHLFHFRIQIFKDWIRQL